MTSPPSISCRNPLKLPRIPPPTIGCLLCDNLPSLGLPRAPRCLKSLPRGGILWPPALLPPPKITQDPPSHIGHLLLYHVRPPAPQLQDSTTRLPSPSLTPQLYARTPPLSESSPRAAPSKTPTPNLPFPYTEEASLTTSHTSAPSPPPKLPPNPIVGVLTAPLDPPSRPGIGGRPFPLCFFGARPGLPAEQHGVQGPLGGPQWWHHQL